MTTTNLSVLKINYLTQAQYDAAVIAETINENELYFISDATIDADQIDIIDSADRYTATDVETALQEIAGNGRTTETVKANADAIGTLEALNTTEKSNLVGSINEVLGIVQSGTIITQDITETQYYWGITSDGIVELREVE